MTNPPPKIIIFITNNYMFVNRAKRIVVISKKMKYAIKDIRFYHFHLNQLMHNNCLCH